MKNLWDDIYRPDPYDRPDDTSQIDKLDAIIDSRTQPRAYDSAPGNGSSPSKSTPDIDDVVKPKLPPVTMQERYNRREEREAPDTMFDRYENREEKPAPQTMMDRLMERDKERERIAKEEQAKLEEAKEDYNKNRRSEVPEDRSDDPNKIDRAARDGAHTVEEELESKHGLSTLKIEKEDQAAYNADFEERIAVLETYHP